jgi:hypothetical protein
MGEARQVMHKVCLRCQDQRYFVRLSIITIAIIEILVSSLKIYYSWQFKPTLHSNSLAIDSEQ